MSVSKDPPQILQRLAAPPLSIRIEPGLEEAELARIETEFSIEFPPDLRALLANGMPVGSAPPPPGATGRSSGFPDWRNTSTEELRRELSRPLDAVLFDVRERGFWFTSWPDRPESLDEALAFAAREIMRAPRLVPVYGRRYISSAPVESGNPILSVYQTDVICYGADLDDYFENEFFDKHDEFHRRGGTVTKPVRHIPFWGELAGFSCVALTGRRDNSPAAHAVRCRS